MYTKKYRLAFCEVVFYYYHIYFNHIYADAILKLVNEKHTRRILGGQIISEEDLTQHMNILSVIIENNISIEELAMTEFLL